MTTKEKIYELKHQKAEKVEAAKALAMDGKHDTEEYKGLKAGIEALKGQIAALEAMDDEDGGAPSEPIAVSIKGSQAPGKLDAVKAFAAAARVKFRVDKAAGDYNSEGVNADGGYTVPEDIVTRVEELKQTKRSLKDLVTVENVTTNKGRRTYKTRAQQTGFSVVAEGGAIPKKAGPQFSVISYAIRKFAGFFPVTNELLEDSDENITNVLVNWIADEGRVTDNVQILSAINTKTAVALDGLDGIKHAVLVDLDAAFRADTRIITNSNGIYWLSTLEDQNGRDLLTPVPSEPGRMQLACGAVVVPVEEIPNADLPNTGTSSERIPFIVGDLKSAIHFFDRKGLTLMSSDTAAAGDFNAYEMDMTLTRAIERFDVKQADASAYINGYIDTTPAEDEGT